MKRWLVELRGERFDIEDYPRWFPNGEIFAVEEGGAVYLTGPAFNSCSDATQVWKTASEAISDMFAVANLLTPGLHRAEIGSLIYENDQGRRMQSVVVVAPTAEARAKAFAPSVSGDTAAEEPEPTEAQTMLAGALNDEHLKAALSVWANKPHTWPYLYRILEEIEKSCGCSANTAGLCTKAQRTRFCQSANAAEISGEDSRHAMRKWEPPANPMSLKEAESFIRDTLLAALKAAARQPK